MFQIFLINYNKKVILNSLIFSFHIAIRDNNLFLFICKKKEFHASKLGSARSKIFRGFYLEFSYSWTRYYHINIMKTLLCLTLVSLVIASVFSSTCPISSNSQPKLYSDAVGLSSQSNNNGSTAQNLVYNYQFDSPFSSTPAVAIGLN